MKKIFILVIFITHIVCSVSKAQNTFPASGSVGIGTTTPNTSSLLEVLSVKKGVLIPRMTKAQRDAIATSASGLLIYQTNSTPGFYYYSNLALWTPMAPPVWSRTGSAGTTASNYLGTSDNNNLRIRTNNIQRAVIDNLGNMGIGTTTPVSKLEVHNGALIISGTTSANLIINRANSLAGTSNQILFEDNGIAKWSLGGSNIGSAGTNDLSLYNYNTASNVLTISTNISNVGIGTTSPEAKLHVFEGSAGSVTGYSDAPLIVENLTNSYINILAPDASETGILFGKPAGNTSGGIIYNSSGNLNGFQFRTNGNTTKMVLTDAGSLGVGTTNPGPYSLKLSGSRGLDIEDASTNGDWELESVAAFYDVNVYIPVFELSWNNEFKGYFSSMFNGSYTSVSDERLKTNIKPMNIVLGKIMQLKPSTYQFKNTTDEQEYNGFIAQDVLKIFPDLVMHTVNNERNLDVYTLNYSGFGVIAIKGIQELLAIITEQNEKITMLENRVSKLEEAFAKINANKK